MIRSEIYVKSGTELWYTLYIGFILKYISVIQLYDSVIFQHAFSISCARWGCYYVLFCKFVMLKLYGNTVGYSDPTMW